MDSLILLICIYVSPPWIQKERASDTRQWGKGLGGHTEKGEGTKIRLSSFWIWGAGDYLWVNLAAPGPQVGLLSSEKGVLDAAKRVQLQAIVEGVLTYQRRQGNQATSLGARAVPLPSWCAPPRGHKDPTARGLESRCNRGLFPWFWPGERGLAISPGSQRVGSVKAHAKASVEPLGTA